MIGWAAQCVSPSLTQRRIWRPQETGEILRSYYVLEVIHIWIWTGFVLLALGVKDVFWYVAQLLNRIYHRILLGAHLWDVSGENEKVPSFHFKVFLFKQTQNLKRFKLLLSSQWFGLCVECMCRIRTNTTETILAFRKFNTTFFSFWENLWRCSRE